MKLVKNVEENRNKIGKVSLDSAIDSLLKTNVTTNQNSCEGKVLALNCGIPSTDNTSLLTKIVIDSKSTILLNKSILFAWFI